MASIASASHAHRELRVCGGTDVGRRREQNQDTLLIMDLASGRHATGPGVSMDLSVESPGMLLVVCDGMGGPPAGDVAARLATTAIENGLRAAAVEVAREPGPALKRIVEEANGAILAEANSHPEERGMGTT